MQKTNLYCFYGSSPDSFKCEDFHTSGNPLNKVQFLKNLFSDYLFCVIIVPCIDSAFVKCPSFTGVSTFSKYKGINLLVSDFPFISEVLRYEKANKC